MATCCICNNIFRKRVDGKGYEKRQTSTHLRRQAVTVFEAMRVLYNYKVKFRLSCTIVAMRK